jgi:cytochrome o ubiquinol oxidase subunit II
LTIAALTLSGCSIGVLRPQGPVGNADRTILIDSVIIMLAIVAPTILAIFGFAWRYRASNAKAKYRPEWAAGSAGQRNTLIS